VHGQGALTNGWAPTGTIAPAGDFDTWTFSANTGDRLVIRVGEISQTGSFTPRIRLQNPSAVQIASAQGALAAEIAVTATNTGTFTLIADDAVGTSATGTYRLSLAKAPGTVFLTPGDEGGPMTNAFQHTGTNLVGDLDLWTFSANAGDAIVLRMGAAAYNPWIRLYGPDGVLVGQAFDGSFGIRDADLRTQATNSGTFTVIAGSLDVIASGSYILTLAHVPETITVSPGDHGGAMANAFQHTGSVDIGDLDVWSFSANAGDAIVLRMGSVGYNPWIRLFGPNGAFIAQAVDGSFGVRDVDLRIQATNSGTFTVAVGSSTQNGTGAYILTLAHVPETITVSPGDHGGAMTNAFQHTGSVDIGDLDVWSFSANAGDAIVLRMGSVGYNPWIRLFGPNGAFIAQAVDGSFGVRDVDLRIQATNSGTFTVVVGSSTQNGTGAYILTLAHVPETITVSPGDHGGAMTNGLQHAGFLEIGDLDVWSFPASVGNVIALRVGTTNAYNPWIRLFGPTGIWLAQGVDGSSGIRDANLQFQATNSGTFTVVAGSWTQNGAGSYILTLAKSPGHVAVAPGDEGGAITNTIQYTGTVQVGDLDVWNFQACRASALSLTCEELSGGGGFTPRLRLLGPTGALLASVQNATAPVINYQTTNSGSFILIVDGGGLNNTGTYRLTGAGFAAEGLRLCPPDVVNGVLDVTGIGGLAGVNGILYHTTEVETPLGGWTPVLTNLFDQAGVFTYTNLFNPAEPGRFFILEQQ